MIAACGLFASTSGNLVLSFVAIRFSAIGFKAAASLFWPIPQGYLDARVAAAVIALINSIGNLGGFFAPATFGYLQQHTGSITGGLYGLRRGVADRSRGGLPRARNRRGDGERPARSASNAPHTDCSSPSGPLHSARTS